MNHQRLQTGLASVAALATLTAVMMLAQMRASMEAQLANLRVVTTELPRVPLRSTWSDKSGITHNLSTSRDHKETIGEWLDRHHGLVARLLKIYPR